MANYNYDLGSHEQHFELVNTHKNRDKIARVYRDPDWGTFHVVKSTSKSKRTKSVHASEKDAYKDAVNHIKEEVENIDELKAIGKKSTLIAYVKKAKKDLGDKVEKQGYSDLYIKQGNHTPAYASDTTKKAVAKNLDKMSKRAENSVVKRATGIRNAVTRIGYGDPKEYPRIRPKKGVKEEAVNEDQDGVYRAKKTATKKFSSMVGHEHKGVNYWTDGEKKSPLSGKHPGKPANGRFKLKVVKEEELNEVGDTERGQKVLRDYVRKAAHKFAYHDKKGDDLADAADKYREVEGKKSVRGKAAMDKASDHWYKGSTKIIGIQRAGKRIKEEMENLDEAKGGYHSVFFKNDGKWMHHFDADNAEDAREEKDGIRRAGHRTISIVTPKGNNAHNWGTDKLKGQTDPHEFVTAHIKSKGLREDAEQLDEIGDTEKGRAALSSYISKAEPTSSYGLHKAGNLNATTGKKSFKRDVGMIRARDRIEDNSPLGHKPKIHDVSHMSDGEVYNRTQTSDKIKNGDVLHMSGGRSAILYKAWPTMVHGESDALHKFGPKGAPKSHQPSVKIAKNIGGIIGAKERNMKEETDLDEGRTYRNERDGYYSSKKRDGLLKATKKSSKAYRLGRDQKKRAVGEEVENIDEISDKMKDNYVAAAARATRWGVNRDRKFGNRIAGLNRALDGSLRYQASKKTQKEEVENIDEISKKLAVDYSVKAVDDLEALDRIHRRNRQNGVPTKGHLKKFADHIQNKLKYRARGVHNASKKIYGGAKVPATEETRVEMDGTTTDTVSKEPTYKAALKGAADLLRHNYLVKKQIYRTDD